MIRSLRVLKSEYGISPEKSDKVESRNQLTPDEYESILNEAGFDVLVKDIQRIEVPHDGYHHISGFSDWIEGILPGVPLDKGCESLLGRAKGFHFLEQASHDLGMLRRQVLLLAHIRRKVEEQRRIMPLQRFLSAGIRMGRPVLAGQVDFVFPRTERQGSSVDIEPLFAGTRFATKESAREILGDIALQTLRLLAPGKGGKGRV